MGSKRRNAAKQSATSTKLSEEPVQVEQQRPRNYAAIQLHFLGLLAYAISYEHLRSQHEKHDLGFGGHFQYISTIALALSALASCLGAIELVLPFKSLPKLRSLVLFIATPLNVIITISYWTIRFYNRSLIPQGGDPLVWHQELGFYLIPAMFTMIDALYVCPTVRVSPQISLSAFVGFVAIYSSWLQMCRTKNRAWPYPILGKVAPGLLYGGMIGAILLLDVTSKAIRLLCQPSDESQSGQAIKVE